MSLKDREVELVMQYDGVNSHPDDRRGPGWNKYTIGHIHIWECKGDRRGVQWAIADLIDGHFCNHEYRNRLRGALDLARQRLAARSRRLKPPPPTPWVAPGWW